MKKIPLKQFPIFLLLLVIFVVFNYFKNEQIIPGEESGSSQVETAHAQQKEDVQVQGSGKIVKLLADDLKGSRHQKFIVRINNSLSVLIAHNIDLAPRIDDIEKGHNISFYGEYLYNNKGGLIHWTHHDPQGSHIDGWLKYNGRTYQ